MTIRTRFAPSPTGYLHIGGVRTALFSWLHARHHRGEFILRIEDTDRERSTEEAVQAILQGMEWLNLQADQGPFYQTRRYDRYGEILQRLLDEGKAYYCYCSRERLEQLREDQQARKEKPRYDGRCRHGAEVPPGVKPVIRFKNPLEGEVVVRDLVRGNVVFQNRELDDLIIARSDGNPTYNFTVVVDDFDMGITHVIRGDDHLNNTPRQLNILQALGADPLPHYAHVPMILGDDGQKLSKRHGAVSVMQYKEQGYLPHALLNYLVRLGWSHGDREIFSLDEMIELFDITEVNKAASTFNPEKLLWLNQHYMKTEPPETVAEHLRWHFEQLGLDPDRGPALSEVVACQAERSKTLREMAENSRFFYEDFTDYEEKAAKQHLRPVILEPLETLRQRLEALPDWTPESLHATVNQVAESFELKLGKIAQPLRVAISGGGISPPIDMTVFLVGRERALRRLDRALAFIRQRADQG